MKQKLLVLGVVIAALAAVALGFVDTRALMSRARGLFFRARSEAGRLSATPGLTGNIQYAAACRANLQRIASAKQKAAQDRGQALGAVTWEEVMRAMYPSRRPGAAAIGQLIPRCPAGGTYSLGTMEELPRCSIGGGDSFDRADDHLILR
jgi:hypothetical protein